MEVSYRERILKKLLHGSQFQGKLFFSREYPPREKLSKSNQTASQQEPANSYE